MSDVNCCGGLYLNGANVSSEWEQIESLPRKTYHHSAVAVDGKIFIVGGKDNNNILRNVFLYDPEANRYIQKANLPVGKSNIDTIIEYNGYIYVLGGSSEAGESNLTYRYNILADRWERIANSPSGRYGITANELEGLFYVIGGRKSGKISAALEIYNPANNTWSNSKNMPTARGYASSFVYNGKIYVAGGYLDDEGTKNATNVVEVYDPILNLWTNVSPMNAERAAFGIAEHNGFFYAFGGGNDTIEKYNPITDSWTMLNCKMPERLTGFGSANLMSTIYIMGGYNGQLSSSAVNNAYKYTPIDIDAPTIELISGNTIEWEEVQGASSYNVCRKIDDGSYELIAENVTETSYTDKNQEPGKTHYYVVRSVNEEGISCHSNEVSVDVEEKPTYDRALLVIRTVNDDWFEYDLTEDEVNDFVHWYDNVPSDDLKAYYVFDKDFNIGPFKSRKDHIVHNKIVFFEIKEY